MQVAHPFVPTLPPKFNEQTMVKGSAGPTQCAFRWVRFRYDWRIEGGLQRFVGRNSRLP